MSKQKDTDVNICSNLCLLAPVIMRNCLPFNIDVKIPNSKQEFFILKGEEAYFLSYDLIEIFEMQLKIDGFEYTEIKIDPTNVGNEIKIRMRDIEGVNLTLFIKIERERAGFELILYSKVCILNYTGMNLEFFTSSKNFKTRIAGQKLIGRNCMLTNKASKLVLSYKGANSSKLKTKQIGYKDDFKIKTRDEETKVNSIYEFVYSTSLNLVTNDKDACEVFSKNIKIFPKFVIVNHLDTPIRYCQFQNHENSRILGPNEREILYWQNSQFPSLISVKTFEKNENPEIEGDSTHWDWTKGIPVRTVGIISVQTRSNKEAYSYKLLRIEKRLIESTIYIIIDKESMEHPTYMIENYSNNVSLMIYQEDNETTVDYIDVCEKTPYGIYNPDVSENKFICQFFIGSLKSNPQFIDDIAATFCIDVVDNQELIKIPTGFSKGKILYMKSYTDGLTKFIKFSDTVDVEPEENENVEATGLDIKINEIGFSVITQICDTERKEIAYIFMSDTKLEMLDTPKHKKINFSVGNFQIDNQINYNILFPVMFRTNTRKKNKPAIDIAVVLRNGYSDLIFIEEASISLCETEIKIDDELLKVLYKFVRDLATFMDTTVVETQIAYEKPKPKQTSKQNRITHTKELELSPRKRKTSL